MYRFPSDKADKGKKVMARKQIEAIAYLRTSSAANVGGDKDSEKRQRAAIEAFARTHGYRLVDLSTMRP